MSRKFASHFPPRSASHLNLDVLELKRGVCQEVEGLVAVKLQTEIRILGGFWLKFKKHPACDPSSSVVDNPH